MEIVFKICSFCRKEEDSSKMYHGFIAMTPPIPKMEEKIDKWGRNDWWKNLERENLTEEESNELEGISTYDQLLNTIGRGSLCKPCYKNENELLNKYYPKNESNF